MGNWNITGWSGNNRQVRPLNYGLKAGQLRTGGYRADIFQSHTTINNYFGTRMPMMDFYNDYGCRGNHDSGMTKFEKWMLGLGFGTTLLGGILDVFALFKKDGAGGTASTGSGTGTGTTGDVTTTTTSPTTTTTTTQQTTTTTDPEDPTVTEPEENNNQNTIDYSNIADGKRLICRDASGNTDNIAGLLSDVKTDANGVPQSFTLTDETSGNKYKYEVRTSSDGTVTYECVSKNGQPTVGAPSYTFENGELVNKEGQNGFGEGIKTKTTTTPSKTRGTGSPSGWYRASGDKNNLVSGITIEDMKNVEKNKIVENGVTRNKTGAEHVLGKILDTKMLSNITVEQKKDLLQQIIKKNPSVFNADGTVKNNADLSKLDVPTIDWIKSNYGIKDAGKSATGASQSVVQKNTRADRGEKVAAKAPNGYYATKDKDGKIRYYNPEHTQITEGSFKAKCPDVHKTLASGGGQQPADMAEVQAWNKSHPNMQVTYKDGVYSTRVTTTSTIMGKVSKNIQGKSFKELKENVSSWISSVNRPGSPRLGYASLGGAMQLDK